MQLGVIGLYVHDQDVAKAFYVDQLGFVVHTDTGNAAYRWLTVHPPGHPEVQLGLFTPGAPVHDEGTAQALAECVAKGAMAPLVLHVDDCRSTYARFEAAGVEMTQEPVARFGNIDAGFRDPSGNAWKIIQLRAGKSGGAA